LSACTTNGGVATLTPLAAARKSARCRIRCMAGRTRPKEELSAESLASARPTGGNDPAATLRRDTGAEAVTAFADLLAGLIGALHGCLSGRRGMCRNGVRAPGPWPAHRFGGLIRGLLGPVNVIRTLTAISSRTNALRGDSAPGNSRGDCIHFTGSRPGQRAAKLPTNGALISRSATGSGERATPHSHKGKHRPAQPFGLSP
jgi:hypothetical protein